MTILVTGGTGLVGSRLLKRMVAAGLDCRAIVRAGKSVPEGVVAVEADLLDASSLGAALEGVSDIIHLAALLRTDNEDDIWKANVDGTNNLIAAARQYSPQARLIMSSTGLVYNADSPRPGREDDAVDPQLAYPASKVVAEKALIDSGLTWAVLRFAFVYGDGDGHIASLPMLAERFKLHPAARFSMVHHRDIATAVDLGLKGAFDGRIVNIVDDAPMSILELTGIAGTPVTPSAEPLVNPWYGQMDATLSRNLGFHPRVRTTWQAVQENAL